MRAVFLCAGYGTRLYPLTQDTPKPLLPIAGEPLLTHLVKKLDPVESVSEAFVVTNAKFFDQISVWRKSLSAKRPVRVMNDGTFSNETRLGAIGDLKLVLQEAGRDQDVLVIAGDNLFDSDFSEFVRFALGKRPQPSICVYDVGDLLLASQYGLVKTDSWGTITDFLEKPKEPPTTLASMGFYYLPQETLGLVDRYLAERQNPDAPGFYIAWLASRIPTHAFRFTGTWFDIGDSASYERAERFYRRFLEKRTLPLPLPSPFPPNSVGRIRPSAEERERDKG